MAGAQHARPGRVRVLAEVVSEQYPDVKILFVSGYGEPDTSLPSRALAKPFSIEDLETVLAEM